MKPMRLTPSPQSPDGEYVVVTFPEVIPVPSPSPTHDESPTVDNEIQQQQPPPQLSTIPLPQVVVVDPEMTSMTPVPQQTEKAKIQKGWCSSFYTFAASFFACCQSNHKKLEEKSDKEEVHLEAIRVDASNNPIKSI